MTLADFTPCPCCVTPDTCGRAGECRPGCPGCKTPHQCSGYGCGKAKASNFAHKADPSMQAVNSAALDELMASDAHLIAHGATGDAMLATVRPGPVLHVWRGGQEVAAVPLTEPAALRLAAWLLQSVAEVRT